MKDKDSAVGSKSSFSFGRSDLIYLLVLAGLSITIGAWLIATTVLITKDGPYYIESAKQVDSEPFDAFSRPHPGYGFLIWGHFKLLSVFGIRNWILSGQIASLVCRTLCVVPLYLLGRVFVCRGYSFLGMLILLTLPYPAEMGADILREWPYLLFFSTSFMFLALGMENRLRRLFFLSGLFCGLGYLIRPESGIIIIICFFWAVATIISRKHKMLPAKVLAFSLYLAAGFTVTAGPHICMSERKLPSKFRLIISRDNLSAPLKETTVPSIQRTGTGIDAVRGTGKLISRLSENLNYYFFIPWGIGLFCGLRKIRSDSSSKEMIVSLMLMIYAVMMILLYINWQYISRRHCLSMAILTFFYVPAGIEKMAGFLSGGKDKDFFGLKKDSKMCWFGILVILGFAANAGKAVNLFPIGSDKKGFLTAAEWIKDNTDPEDIIAAEDLRIPLYAGREGLRYNDKYIPENYDYILDITDEKDGQQGTGEYGWLVNSLWLDEDKKKLLKIFQCDENRE